MNFTTMEQLQESVSASYGAVLRFGDYVFVTDCHWQGGFTATIYTFVKASDGTTKGSIECPLALIEEAPQHFADNGHAIEWCIARTTH